MSDEFHPDDKDYRQRFFARLAALAAPHADVLLLIEKATFYPIMFQPRLLALFSSGQGLDFCFATGFQLRSLGGKGLRRAFRSLLLPDGGYLSPPRVKMITAPEVAAENCWEKLSQQLAIHDKKQRFNSKQNGGKCHE